MKDLNAEHKRLTRSVKRALDLIWWLAVITLVLYPLIIVVGAGQESKDVQIPSSFRIYADVSPDVAPDSVSLADTIVRGQGEVRIETNDTFAWYLSHGIRIIVVIVLMYGLAQLRKVFTALSNGQPFSPDNAERIRRLGYVVVAWNALIPVLQGVGSWLILDAIELELRGAQFTPSFGLSIGGIIVGMAIVVLAGVLREAVEAHEDRSLTI